ncbi:MULTISPECIES: helix-turn-helix domain-containing protein [unclassified Mesorhizobium]|uniref:AraC family transcriptional regulator n=1 Tax=unclassified Mesorhizobium TaxID=325217 RepID=UPI00163D7BB5|nr:MULTISPECIES: helix-turn-helix domain-containing protein [unclassified Mesorhizobium]
MCYFISMDDAKLLEVLTRGAAVGVFLGFAIVIGRGRLSSVRITGLLFCLAAAAHTLTQMPLLAGALAWLWPAVWAFSAMGAGFLWAFAVELFEDRGRAFTLRLMPAAGLLIVSLAAALMPPGASKPLWLLQNLIAGSLAGHALFVIGGGWRNDLVETRRGLRGPILAMAALYAVAVIGMQILELAGYRVEALSPVAAAALLALGLAGIGTLLQVESDLFAPISEARRGSIESMVVPAGEEARIAKRLDRLMREERVYREPGLSIAVLAVRLGIPDHKLRRVINRQLGHRNFSAFLNQWRLQDTKQALLDPDQFGVPISTIALDAGFQSIGPFNRAFRQETGLTPTAFRAKAAASPGSIPPLHRGTSHSASGIG